MSGGFLYPRPQTQPEPRRLGRECGGVRRLAGAGAEEAHGEGHTGFQEEAGKSCLPAVGGGDGGREKQIEVKGEKIEVTGNYQKVTEWLATLGMAGREETVWWQLSWKWDGTIKFLLASGTSIKLYL